MYMYKIVQPVLAAGSAPGCAETVACPGRKLCNIAIEASFKSAQVKHRIGQVRVSIPTL